jgi:large subunit ribosomal protein L2
MANLKKYKPTTPSLRSLITLHTNQYPKKPLLKHSIKGLKNPSGTNNTGKITSYHKGGGHKKKYRKINFKRHTNSTGIVTSIEYDPFRSAEITSIYDFSTKRYDYIIAPKNLTIGTIVKSGDNANPNNGHSLPLFKIPLGSLIHNVSTKNGKISTVSRSAGAFTELLEKTYDIAKLKLSSGKHITVPTSCFATIGTVSNDGWKLTNKGKAGRSRWLNKRPKVRGVAMNPIDHPHGGGEGKTSGGRTSVTPWGKPTKNKKTSRSGI